MPNIVTKKIRIDNARRFIETLGISTNSLYTFIGRPQPWADDSAPPVPSDTVEEHAKVWDEIVALKRILPTDVKPVVKRINWTLYETYAAYDNEDEDLQEKNFYVMNQFFDVYKCIDNRNNSVSTVEPFGKSPNIFSTSDGYKWKYLYSIPVGDQLKFLTRNWMPVLKNDEVASVAKDGGIERIVINNGGINHSFRANVGIIGDGTGANISIISRLGVIQDFIFTNSGSNYRYARAVVNDTTGRFGNLRPIISPVGGHGFDPVSELGSHFIMVNTRTEYDEGFGDFPTDIQYRTIGLVKNPKGANGNVATSLTLGALRSIQITDASGSFNNNEFVGGFTSLANAYIVSSNVVSGNGYIKYIQTNDLTSNFRSFSINETVIGSTSGSTGRITSITSPEVQQDSGDIIYIENRTPIRRLIDQAENLHLVLEF
jgi:hypothetical protein